MTDNDYTILIVDNEIEICHLFKDFFDFMGYASTFETDGEKVLRDLESMDYDILFVDLKLDTISGIEILKKSKSVHPLSEVIVVTGYGSDETVFRALHYGALSYIQKPISFTEIKAQTEMAFTRHRFNARTSSIRSLLLGHDRALADHFADILNLDRLFGFLNLSIDIDTLCDSILSGLADVLPGHIYSLLLLDSINREFVIYSDEAISNATMRHIEEQIAGYYEKAVNQKLDKPYDIRVSLSTKVLSTDASVSPLAHVFVPIFIENSIRGILGLSTTHERLTQNVIDIVRIVSFRASFVLTNATLHRDTKLLAITDGLTGLLNHRAFHDRLTNEFDRYLRYGSYLSLIVADFDDLKVLNDTFGHPVGDEVLRKIGDILRDTSRESDILARYGGDEFVLLLPQTSLKNACNLAERIRGKMMNTTFTVQGHKINSTLSMGVSAVPQDGVTSPQDLLENADRALYESKRTGKNRVSVAGPAN